MISSLSGICFPFTLLEPVFMSISVLLVPFCLFSFISCLLFFVFGKEIEIYSSFVAFSIFLTAEVLLMNNFLTYVTSVLLTSIKMIWLSLSPPLILVLDELIFFCHSILLSSLVFFNSILKLPLYYNDREHLITKVASFRAILNYENKDLI